MESLEPEIGDMKLINKFLFFPVWKGGFHWLKRATLQYEYVEVCGMMDDYDGLHDYKYSGWKLIKVID